MWNIKKKMKTDRYTEQMGGHQKRESRVGGGEGK